MAVSAIRTRYRATDNRTAGDSGGAAEGWTDEPITVWQHHSILLDGHNRYRIWQELGDDYGAPEIEELDFNDKEESLDWIDLNLMRNRNPTDKQQSEIRGRMALRRKKKIGGAQPGNKHAVKKHEGQNDPHVSAKSTHERIAKETGVSPKTVKRDQQFARSVKELNDRGVISRDGAMKPKSEGGPSRDAIIQSAKETDDELESIIPA